MRVYVEDFIIIFTLNLAIPYNDMPKIPVTYNHAIDGDTISVKVNNRTKTVRLLLIDTPESKAEYTGATLCN